MNFSRVEVYENGELSHIEDTRTVESARREKQEYINMLREVKLDEGIWYMGHYWASDTRARNNVTGVIAGVTAGIALPPGFVWRDNNNNNVPFTATNLVTLGGYLIHWVNLVYGYSWNMKLQLDGLTTLQQIDDYVITWPSPNIDGTMPPQT